MTGSCPTCDAPLCVTCGGCDDECGTCECYDTEESHIDEDVDEVDLEETE